MSDLANRLQGALAELLAQSEDLEAAAVVSFDGLPMASALPPEMDEDRVAAMSAALLSLGEKAALGLGRGDLNQVYIEGDSGTVFLVSAEDEAVLVAVAAAGAKAGLMLYEVRHAAKQIGAMLARPRNLEAVPADVFVDTSNVMAMPATHGIPNFREASPSVVGAPVPVAVPVAEEVGAMPSSDVPTAFPAGIAADLYGERRIESTAYTQGVWR